MPDKRKLVDVPGATIIEDNPTPQNKHLVEVPDAVAIDNNSVDTSELSNKISDHESKGDYSVTNPNSSATGKYQFLWGNKPGEGFGETIKKVTGVKSQDEFLNNPDAQEKFFQYHVENNLKPAVGRISAYNKKGYSDSQLAMLVHFKGEEGAREWLQKGRDNTRAHNSSIDSYVGKPEGAESAPPLIVDNNTIPSSIAASGPPHPSESEYGVGFADKTLDANKDLNFVKRYRNPDLYPVINNSDGSFSTHKMQSADNFVYPTIIQQSDGTLKELKGKEAYDYAMKTGEYIKMPDEKSAIWFANNGYKNASQNNSLAKRDPITGLPVEPKPDEKQQASKATADATAYIANDIIANAHPDIQNNLQTVPFHQPGSIVHDITNPHGEPGTTGTYVKDRLQQLQQERNQKINEAGFNDPFKAAGANPQALTDINSEYDQKAAKLKESASSLVGLQLFNKDYQDKKYTQAEAITAKDAATQQKDAAIKAANEHLHDKVGGEDKYDVNKANSEFQSEIKNINSEYNKQLSDIQNHTKWDDVRLGLEHDKLLGDQQAQSDLDRYDAGKPLSPESKLKYQLTGQQILKSGNLNTVNEKTAAESAAHIKTPEQIETENQQVFNDRRAQAIGNAKYHDENLLFRAIVPHFGSMSPEDVKTYGEQIGLTPAQIKKIDPESVPTSSTVWQQFAKGALNTAAPIYERGVRSAAAMAGANPDDVNEAFKNGWESQRGLGAAMVGNMPSDQNSFNNVRGAIGQMFEGAGGLLTFGGEILGATKGLEAIGATAEKAHDLANLGVMAFNGYNSAYHDANELIGDKPQDEWKRQAYAITSGLIEGKIFSINPKADLLNKAIGMPEGGLIGKDFLEDLRKAKDASILEDPSFKQKIATAIKEGAKENGTQVTLAVANEMSKDILNTIVNPQKKKDIPADIKNAAISTSLAMFFPSILAGINHAVTQNPLMKAAMFEIGTNPQKYSQLLSNQLEAKQITPEQAQQSHEAILTMKNIIDNTPVINANGKPLTPDQVKDYSWNMMRGHTLQKQADAITEKATQSNLMPDKAQLEPINKQITELQGERKKILSEKAQTRVPTPLPELLKEEPAAERSVATDDAKEKEPTPENKLGSEKEKDITLQPQEHQQQKPTENETSIEEQNGRQSNPIPSKGEKRRQDPLVRQAADSEGRNVEEENRVLKTPESEAKPQEEQSPVASAVEEPKPKKEKKNRFAKIEEPVVKTEEDATIPSEEQKQESHQQSGEQEHAPVEPAGREAQAASPEGSDSHISSEAKQEEVIPEHATPSNEGKQPEAGAEPAPSKRKARNKKVDAAPVADVTGINVGDISGEKPPEEPTPERSVATEPAKETIADLHKSPLTIATENFNKYKDAVIKKEAALEKLTAEGKKKGDIDYDKKVAELEQAKNKKNEAFKQYDKEFRKDQNPNAHTLSKNIREKTKKLADTADKKATKGVKRAGSGFTDGELIKLIGNKVADLVELGENLHLAIRKAIDEFRGKVPKDLEQELRTNLQEGEHAEKYRDNLRHEPPLLQNKEDYDLSVDLVKDIKAGKDTFEEVMDDLHEANINPERKKAIADFIDREVNLTNQQRENAKAEYNSQTLRQPEHQHDYYKNFELKESDKVSSYLSYDTLKDVSGEDPQFDRDSKTALQLNDVIDNMANVIGVAKMHFGDDVIEYGQDLLGKIKEQTGEGGSAKLTGKEAEKALLSANALANELRGEKIRLTEELKTAEPERKNEINSRINKITAMTRQTDILYRDITSHASKILNVARANRAYRDGFFASEYANKILSEKERAAKENIESALDNTDIPDKVAEKTTAKTPEEAEKENKEIIEEKNKSEAGKNVESDLTKKEPAKGKEKSKSTVERMKEKGKKKESSSEKKSIIGLTLEAKERMGSKTPEEFLNNLKDKIKKKKC